MIALTAWTVRVGRTWMMFHTLDRLHAYMHDPKHVKHITSPPYQWTGAKWERH